MKKTILLIAFCLINSFCFAQKKIGIITDIPESIEVRFLIDSLIQEIDNTTGINEKIISPKELQFFGISSISDAQEVYTQMKADLVIAIGSVTTKAVSNISNLSIPLIGVGVIDHSLQDIPFIDGTSGKDNFTYLLTSRDLLQEIESFKRMTDFQNLTIINDSTIRGSIDVQKAKTLIDSLEQTLDIKINTLWATDDISATIETIENPDAVFLSSLLGKGESYISQLSAYFIEQKIPSFSSLRQHVDYGILGCSSGDNRIQKVIRRIAIVADQIFSGKNASENFVALSLGEEVFLNVATMKKLGFSPDFEFILTANLVGEDDLESKSYSFNEIAEIALKENLNLQISYKDIDLSELDIKSNRSLILPSLSAGLTAFQINEERANAIINSPERSLNMDFTLSQVIYSEEALAAIKISRYLNSAQEFKTEADALDILFDTYSSYLNVLSAKTNLNIQKQNLDNTKTNLELAKIRVAIGEANNSDLYRWESEVALATQNLIDAQAVLLTIKLQLNNLLANNLESDYEIKDLGLDDDLYRAIASSPISELIKTPEDIQLASNFLVQESLKQNPNKKQLLENIKATERQLQLTKRLLYVPTVAFQAQLSEVLARGGEGSEQPDPNALILGNGLQDNSWSVGVNLSYPLFTGFNRRIDKQKVNVQLEQLELSNTNLDQALELSIRSSTVNLLSATTNLKYSKKASESANQNYILVQNYYREGAVNITQLIDAQEASLNASLQAAVAVYEYILANLQLEYSIGLFSMFLTEEQVTEFNERFLKYIMDNR